MTRQFNVIGTHSKVANYWGQMGPHLTKLVRLLLLDRPLTSDNDFHDKEEASESTALGSRNIIFTI